MVQVRQYVHTTNKTAVFKKELYIKSKGKFQHRYKQTMTFLIFYRFYPSKHNTKYRLIGKSNNFEQVKYEVVPQRSVLEHYLFNNLYQRFISVHKSSYTERILNDNDIFFTNIRV